MPMPADRDHRVALARAQAMVRRYRQASPKAVRAGMWPRKALETILDQDGCAGVRFYYAHDDNGGMGLIAVGVDQEGNDMTGGVMIDTIWPCPPICSLTGPLAE